jgi:hypothetical protein
MAGGIWLFDAREAPHGKNLFTRLCDADPTGRLECFAYRGGRFYWTLRATQDAPLRLMSSALDSPQQAFDHGEIVDADGRRPTWAGDLITDGQGLVYMVGRWAVSEADMQTIGVLRHGTRLAVFFSVLDVREDLRKISGQE